MLNKYFFSAIGLTGFFLLSNHVVWAQQRFLKKLVPHHAVVQHSGGIGYFAIGAGYSTRNNKLSGELLYGYLPKSIGGVEIHSATVKLQWIPLKIIEKQKLFLKPLITGILINHSFGDQYFGFNPDNYPYSYYKFPTSLNAALVLGSEIGLQRPKAATVRAVSFYYELIVFDRELISFVTNSKHIHLDDILTLGLGIRVHFRR